MVIAQEKNQQLFTEQDDRLLLNLIATFKQSSKRTPWGRIITALPSYFPVKNKRKLQRHLQYLKQRGYHQAETTETTSSQICLDRINSTASTQTQAGVMSSVVESYVESTVTLQRNLMVHLLAMKGDIGLLLYLPCHYCRHCRCKKLIVRYAVGMKG